MRFLSTAALALASVVVLAACGDGGGPGPDRLSKEEVGGVYQICSLVFTPEGGSPPPLDVRAATMELSAAGAVQTLTLGRTVQDFALEYTRRGDVLTRRFDGSYTTGTDRVFLNFDTGSAVADALLLPDPLTVRFVDGAAGRRLEIDVPAGTHSVRRADFERLAGQSFPNARDNIVGTLTGRFAAGTCD